MNAAIKESLKLISEGVDPLEYVHFIDGDESGRLGISWPMPYDELSRGYTSRYYTLADVADIDNWTEHAFCMNNQ